MLAIRGLYEVAIPVRQLQKSIEMFSASESAFGTMADVGCSCGLGPAWSCFRSTTASFPPYHFAFTVDEADLDRAAAILGECGVSTRGPIFHNWIPGKSLYFEDIDGHELELFAPSLPSLREPSDGSVS